MAFYSVHNRADAPAEGAIFVREGFSAGALVLTVLWALWHRMWLAAGVLLAIFGGIALAGNLLGVGEGVIVVANFVISLIFGFEARDLQIRALIARGYAQAGFSFGKNLDEAEIRYFHNTSRDQRPSVPALMKPVLYPGAPDPLGIFGNV